MIPTHSDTDVQRAIDKLCDELCQWERMTGLKSVLIIRETGGFTFRAMSGKPNIPADIEDELLISQL